MSTLCKLREGCLRAEGESAMNSGHFHRVSKRRPCRIYGREDWCGYTGHDDDPVAAVCMRVESDRATSNGGWLHRLRDDETDWRHQRRVIATKPKAATGEQQAAIAKLAGDCQAAIGRGAPISDLRRLADLAESLGLSISSLRALGIGWSKAHKAWTFPMQNAKGRITGIRLRHPSGKKLSVRGGKEGLFLPDAKPGGRLLICEGPTDVAALFDLRLYAVGRPSCSGGTQHLRELVKKLAPEEIVIVADADSPGQRGADRLASVLLRYSAIKVVASPGGMNDARQWKRAGATAADIEALIQAASVKTLQIRMFSKQ